MEYSINDTPRTSTERTALNDINRILSKGGLTDRNLEALIRFYNEAKANNITLLTRYQYIRFLGELSRKVGVKDFEEITKDEIVAFFSSLSNKGTTINTKKTYIRSFYKWLNGGKEYPPNVAWIRTKRRYTTLDNKKILQPEQVKRMVLKANNIRDKALVMTLYDSALRAQEFINLNVGDVQFGKHSGKIVVKGGAGDKTGSGVVPIIDSVPLLQRWINEHPDRDNPKAPLWITTHTRRGYHRITYSLLNLIIKDLAIAAELHTYREETTRRGKKEVATRTSIIPHLFRHSRLTTLADTLNERELTRIARWTRDSQMPAVYVHPDDEHIEKKMLQERGLEPKDDEGTSKVLAPRPCPRGCKGEDGNTIMYSAIDKFCLKCGIALDVKTAMEQMDSEKGTLEGRIGELEAKAAQVTEWQKAGEALLMGLSTHPGFAEALKKAMAELPEHSSTEKGE